MQVLKGIQENLVLAQCKFMAYLSRKQAVIQFIQVATHLTKAADQNHGLTQATDSVIHGLCKT